MGDCRQRLRAAGGTEDKRAWTEGVKDELQECGDLASLPSDAIDPPPHPGHWATPNPKDTFVQNKKVSFPPVDAAHG